MSTSHSSSRPAQSVVGGDTIRISLSSVPKNTRRHTRLAQQLWFFVGVALLIADGTAMHYFADSAAEACIIAALTLPTALLVIAAACNTRGWEAGK
jgi:hypothetical protein